jgi:hypothetical protein
MKKSTQWVVAGGDKIPLNPRTGKCASPTDLTTCGTLQAARGRAGREDLHVGWVLHWPAKNAGASLVCVDLDNCIDDDGNLSPEAAAIVADLDSYTEVSRSGRGLHILLHAELPPGRRRFPGGIEIYNDARYIILTGDVRPGWGSDEVNRRPEAFAALYARLSASVEPEAPAAPLPTTPLTLADDELLTLAFAAVNGPELERLLAGDISGYVKADGSPDHSAADLAAASKLYFWTQDDDQVERIITGSPLGSREKWQKRPDYRQRTLSRARQRSTFYTPPQTQRHTVPAVDPCTAERDLIAELRAENAALKAELDQTRAERDQAKADLSAVIKTLANPNLGGDAAGKAFILAATEVQYQRHSRPTPDGYCRVTASRVADNVHYINGEPTSAPAQVSPRTVTKYMDIAAKRKLIPAEKRTIRVPKGDHDIPTDVWHWKAAPTLADQLAPLATGSVYDDDNPRPLRGGDPAKRRRLKELPTCPECGGRHVACRSCGVMFEIPAAIDLDSGDTLTAAEFASERPDDTRHPVPADKDVSIGSVVDGSIADNFVADPAVVHSHTVPTSKQVRVARAAADLQRRAETSPDSWDGPPYEPDTPPQPTLFVVPDASPRSVHFEVGD